MKCGCFQMQSKLNQTNQKPQTNHTESGRDQGKVALMVHPAINNARVKTWGVFVLVSFGTPTINS